MWMTGSAPQAAPPWWPARRHLLAKPTARFRKPRASKLSAPELKSPESLGEIEEGFGSKPVDCVDDEPDEVSDLMALSADEAAPKANSMVKLRQLPPQPARPMPLLSAYWSGKRRVPYREKTSIKSMTVFVVQEFWPAGYPRQLVPPAAEFAPM